MKTLLFLLLTIPAMAQYTETKHDLDNAANVYMRGGYNFDISRPQLGAGIVFRMHNIGLGAELNIPWSDSEAKEFGVRLSYKFGSLEVGAARYAMLVTTDKYDADKNGFANSVFVAYHKNILRQNWFVQADYMNGVRLTLGVNGLISKLK